MHTPSCITVVSDETFDTQGSREGSISPVPSSNPPGYLVLSPQPPQSTPLPETDSDSESEELVPPIPIPIWIFTRAPSNMLNVQQIYQRIWSGTDLNQVAFNKGRITFWNLQSLDCHDNPELYHDSPDAAGEYSLSIFQEEKEREVEVEEEN